MANLARKLDISKVCLKLNANEIQLIELALEYLCQQAQSTQPSSLSLRGLKAVSDWEVKYLQQGLNDAKLRDQLFFYPNREALWWFDYLEDIDLLITALTEGMTEDFITVLAAERADYEQDMVNVYLDNAHTTPSLSEMDWHTGFQGIRNGYYHLLNTCQAPVLVKLKQARQSFNQYPF